MTASMSSSFSQHGIYPRPGGHSEQRDAELHVPSLNPQHSSEPWLLPGTGCACPWHGTELHTQDRRALCARCPTCLLAAALSMLAVGPHSAPFAVLQGSCWLCPGQGVWAAVLQGSQVT